MPGCMVCVPVKVSVAFVMKNEIRAETPSDRGSTVSFGDHFQSSQQFDTVFKEGMALVERTATYLDGNGRRDAKGLASATTVLYATESMRLTTRLLDIASWLLIRRALKQGEIDESEARLKRQRVKLLAFGRPGHTNGYDDLPHELRGLIDESFVMLDRIVQLDKAMSPDAVAPGAKAANPVGAQILQLNRMLGLKPS